jgi:hypothetical protein
MTEVAKTEGCELNFTGVGAFVWWATQAESETEFLRKLREATDQYRLLLLEGSDIRPFSESDEVSDDFFEMVEQARKDENCVLLGTFHTWPHHDA